MKQDIASLIGLRHTPSYEKTLTGRQLILNMTGQDRIIHYQIEMIKFNKPPLILPVKIRRINHNSELCYDLQEMIPLSQYLKSSLNKKEFFFILESALRCIDGCKKYFLYEHCLLFDIEYVFIHPGKKEIGLVYLPVKLQEHTVLHPRHFFGQLLHKLQSAENTDDLRMMKRIADLCKTEEFTIYGLMQLIKEWKFPYLSGQTEDCSKDKPFLLEKRLDRETPKASNSKSGNFNRKSSIKIAFIIFAILQITIIVLLSLCVELIKLPGVTRIIFVTAFLSFTIIDFLVLNHMRRELHGKNKDINSRERWDHLITAMAKENNILKHELVRYQFSTTNPTNENKNIDSE